MDRRTFLRGGVGLLATPLTTEAPPPQRLYRIGWLDATPADFTEWRRLFVRALADLGWREHQDYVVEWRQPPGNEPAHLQQLPDLAADLVKLKVDVLVAVTTVATEAALDATLAIPTVYANVVDPPTWRGTNVTGVANNAAALVPQQLELLRALVPGASRVTLLWDPTDPANRPLLARLHAEGPRHGLALQPTPIRTFEDVRPAFRNLVRVPAEAIFVLGTVALIGSRHLIATLALEHRMPLISNWYYLTEVGGLASYSWDFRIIFGRTAWLVDRILRGAKPTDLPVEQPTTFRLTINLRAARALGVTVPSAVLARAPEVIP